MNESPDKLNLKSVHNVIQKIFSLTEHLIFWNIFIYKVVIWLVLIKKHKKIIEIGNFVVKQTSISK